MRVDGRRRDRRDIEHDCATRAQPRRRVGRRSPRRTAGRGDPFLVVDPPLARQPRGHGPVGQGCARPATEEPAVAGPELPTLGPAHRHGSGARPAGGWSRGTGTAAATGGEGRGPSGHQVYRATEFVQRVVGATGGWRNRGRRYRCIELGRPDGVWDTEPPRPWPGAQPSLARRNSRVRTQAWRDASSSWISGRVSLKKAWLVPG